MDFIVGATGGGFNGPPPGRLYIMAGIPRDSVEACPDSFTRVRGLPVVGEVASLCESDDDALVTRPDQFSPAPLNNPAVQIEVSGTFNPVGGFSILHFTVESGTTAPENVILQNILLWNFTTGQYDLFDQRLLTQADTVAEIVVDANPGDYTSNKGGVQALIQHVGVLFSLPSNWTAGIDQAVWRI